MHLEGVRKGSMTQAGLVSGMETLLQAKGVRQEGKEREKEKQEGGRRMEEEGWRSRWRGIDGEGGERAKQ